MLRIGVVGCGKIADSHVEEVNKLSNAQISAVCDLEPVIARQLAQRYGVPAYYSDFAEMLGRERLDVIHITTPPQSHKALVRQSIEAGCHVFVEKPLAITAPDARELIEIVDGAGKKLSINYWPNFEAPALALKRHVCNGEIGDAVHVESFIGYDLSGSFGQALLNDEGHWVHRLPGKLFQNMLDHLLNKIVPFLPPGDIDVQSWAFQRRAKKGNWTDEVLDELRVFLRTDTTTAYGTFSSHARPVGNYFRLYGTKNTIELDYNARTVAFAAAQRYPSAVGRLFPAFGQARQYWRQGRANLQSFRRSQFGFFAGMNRLLAAFYDSIANDSDLPIPYSEITRVAEVMDRVISQVYPKGGQ